MSIYFARRLKRPHYIVSLAKLHASSYNKTKRSFTMNRHSDTIKQETINLYRAGTPTTKIAISLSISRSTVYKWLKEQNIAPPNLTKSRLSRLENKVKRLEGIIEVLQSVNCSVNSPLDEKLDALERLYGKYSVHAYALRGFESASWNLLQLHSAK